MIEGKRANNDTIENDRDWSTWTPLTSGGDQGYSKLVSNSWYTSAIGGKKWNHLFSRKVSFLTDYFDQFGSICQSLKVWSGAVVVIIVRWLNLELPLQSAPITTEIAGSQPAQG
jgi:hypothetical protein